MATSGAHGIGRDEWVEQEAERRESGRGPLTPVKRAFDRIPYALRVAALCALAALLPQLTGDEFIIRVALDCVLFAMLAIGLNVIVGLSGQLDLGYVVYYGFGAYIFAELSSEQLGHHWATWQSLPVVIVACGLIGYILGQTARRLSGDYLAIVTLFFAQMFVLMANNVDRITLPWADSPLTLTGGPNGIVGIDTMKLPAVGGFDGFELLSVKNYFYLAVVAFGIVMLAVHLLDQSRTGRAWRSLRDDPLAAQLMTIPANRLKVFAFVIGAGIAGLAGAIFASNQISIFSTNFEVPLLITIYAAIVLGGVGSQAGVVLGAVIITALPELLRDPANSRLIFYGLILLAVLLKVRPWWKLGVVIAMTAALAAIVHVVGSALSERATAGAPVGGGKTGAIVETVLLLPSDSVQLGNAAFVGALGLVGAIVLTRGWLRLALVPPALYLGAFVWETRLVNEASITNQLLLGGVLVVMMAARPYGLLGKRQVEIV